MQVLAAPNREDVNRAHAKGRWLHIGVPNTHNLRYIGKDRAFIYWVLFLSSTPLHLSFNSVVFANLQANEYYVITATDNWTKDEP